LSMQTQRRNPPARIDAADSRKKTKLERELESDPIIAEVRRFYDCVVDEPLPNGLLELLRRLDEVERNR
jgi:hypothetical protein